MNNYKLKFPLKYGYNNLLLLEDETNFIDDVLALLKIVGGEKFVKGEVPWDSRMGTVLDIFRHDNIESLEEVEIKTFIQKAINTYFNNINIYNFSLEKDVFNRTITIKMSLEKKLKNKLIKKDVEYEWSY